MELKPIIVGNIRITEDSKHPGIKTKFANRRMLGTYPLAVFDSDCVILNKKDKACGSPTYSAVIETKRYGNIAFIGDQGGKPYATLLEDIKYKSNSPDLTEDIHIRKGKKLRYESTER